MSEKQLRHLAKPMLLTATLIWGSSFFVMKNTLDALPVQYLLAFRFTIGAVLMSALCAKKWRTMTRDYLWRGGAIGVVLYLAYAVQTYGLALTTPSKNAFLTSVYCVLVPFLYWGIAKIKPDIYNISAAVLCVAGVGFVSLNGDLSVQSGDLLTLLCAVFYALHIVAVAKFSSGKDIYLLTALEFAACAVCAWAAAAIFEPFHISALRDGSVLIALGYLGVFATRVALLFQNVGQVHSDPNSAAVILSLESVFGVLCSVLFADDRVTLPMAVGFVLIFAAVICSETKLAFLRRGAES